MFFKGSGFRVTTTCLRTTQKRNIFLMRVIWELGSFKGSLVIRKVYVRLTWDIVLV